ncbi:hypothetical protein [Bacillus sp. J37]|uniref:hypothetical protein n=1 Tax=Bacillus sp. J37 TaxID=935837 RepID=UPI00047872B0|nr:hypothetical protein [Bacillus sp. J37]
MKKFAPLLLIAIAIVVIGYFDSPKFAEKEQAISTFPVPEEETTSATAAEEEEIKGIPELESRLVDMYLEDGYSVEVYQEYEVYKDEQGNVIERVATENYNYLRYKQ